MKKLWLSLTIFIFVLSSAYSQTITQSEATDIFKKTLSYLSSNDIASFVDLWYLNDDAPWHNNNKPYTEGQIRDEFRDLSNFLVVPLVKKMPIERIEITDFQNSTILAKYKIKAYFKIDDHLQLGYGFLVDYIDNKWVIRWHGEQTISPNN